MSPTTRRGTPALPFTHRAFRVERPDHSEPEPRSLSGRIRWHRKRLGLTQKELGEKVGVTADTVRNWEKERTRPSPELLQEVVQALDFTGSFTVSWPASFKISTGQNAEIAGQLQLARHRRRLSQEALANQLGVSAETVWKWENGAHRPRGKFGAAVDRFIDGTLNEDDFFAIRVRILRKHLGLSQPEFAARLGVASSTVSRWERAESSPRLENVEQIEDLLKQREARTSD